MYWKRSGRGGYEAKGPRGGNVMREDVSRKGGGWKRRRETPREKMSKIKVARVSAVFGTLITQMFTINNIVNHFGDMGCVIANTFKVLSNE